MLCSPQKVNILIVLQPVPSAFPQCICTHPFIFFAFSGPCDIKGDISFEELRAKAYEESRQGNPLQSIVTH
jgi:hypothetical protein